MARIPSPNPDFQEVSVPGQSLAYPHPSTTKQNTPIPMAFQVTSPFNRRTVLFPHALVLHVNPMSLAETGNQKITRFQTRGGFVEQHWGHDLVELQADQSTGSFMNIRTGLASVVRRKTIAWDRFRDLYDLFRNNGSVHDPYGNIVLQGQVMVMYDMGVYLGTFRSFQIDETADSPFSFKLSWTFKVEETLLTIDPNFGGREGFYQVPTFQNQNIEGSSAGGIKSPAAAVQQDAKDSSVPVPGGNNDETTVNRPEATGPRGQVGA